MKKFNNNFIIMMILVLTILAACSGNSDSNSASGETANNTGDSQEQVELRWAMWTATPEEKKVWEDLASKVTEKYPHITIKFETDTFNGYWDKLQTQIASGTAPDIISLQSMRTTTFAQYGAFEPLNKYIENSPDFDIDDFEDSIMDGLAQNGDQLAIPYDFGPYILYYNKDLFDKQGVEYPTADDSWEDFLKKAKAVTHDENGDGKPDVYGAVIGGSLDQSIPWIWSNGGDYFNDEKTKSLIQEPAATEAIQFISNAIEEKAAIPFTDPGNENFETEQFFGGKAAMMLDGQWRFVNVRSKADFDWDIATMPKGKEGSVTWVAGSGFGIYANSEHKEEAWKAIEVMMSKEGHQYLGSTGRGYPARKSAVEAFKNASDKPANLDAITEAGKEARPFKNTTNWQEITNMVNDELEKVWYNNKPAAEVTELIEPKLNELLQEHQENVAE